jgi:predicted permease
MEDLRYALRGLRKHPGFAAVAVVTLAFGIGVNASLFSLVNAFFLQPLPVEESSRLVMVLQRGDVLNVPFGYPYPDYRDFREQTTGFDGLAAYMPTPVHLGAAGQSPERTWIEVVSPNYFALARVRPAYGDFPRPDDAEGTGGAATVVLSHRYWQRRFGGDPALVGSSITLNGKSFTVTGIAPDGFAGLSWAMAVSAFVPAGAIGSLIESGDAFRDNRGAPAWRVIGRLGSGATVESARAEIDLVLARLVAAYPAEHKGSRSMVVPENLARPDPSVAGVLPIVAAVFGAMVLLVLAIACANVANLTLSRAAARHREFVIRCALGASRFRLVRLQIVESLVLACAAGLLGLLLARWAGYALTAFAPAGDIPVNDDHPWDWRIYVFTVLLSAVAGVAAGVWPARWAARFDVAESLKRGGPAGASRHALRNLLVVGQVTLSLVVLVGAGLFLHSLRQMRDAPLGFRPNGIVMASVDLGLQQYSSERGRQFLEELQQQVSALPGVASATVAAHVPFDYGMQFADIATGEEIPGARDGYIAVAFNVVGTQFFDTMGSAIVAGRALDRRDGAEGRPAAVVNETMARTFWSGGDALGRRFRFGRDGVWMDVVGIAADGRYVMLGEGPRPYFYLPMAQAYRSPATLLVRCASDSAALARSIRRILTAMDPTLPVFNVRTMEQHIDDSAFGLMPLRAGASMAAVQGAIALFLAVMGLYAVVSFAVTRRTREIGVRMALGASHRDILRLVVKEGMRLTLRGLAAGCVLALGLGVVLSKVLYGLRPVDAGVIGGIALLLLGISVLACYLPARRATRVDPLVALRQE